MKKRFVIVFVVMSILIVFFLCFFTLNNCNMQIYLIENNKLDRLEQLLNLGITTNCIDGIPILDVIGESSNKKTPLMYACYAGNKEAVELLVNHGADVNYMPINAKLSPIMWTLQSTAENRVDILKILIENGSDVNYIYRVGNYHILDCLVDNPSVLEDETTIISMLDWAGTDLNKKDYLYRACYTKHDDLIKYFIENCEHDVSGYKYIAQYCRGDDRYSKEIFDILLENGADIYDTDDNGKRALDYIHGDDAEKWVAYLIEKTNVIQEAEADREL